jgi:hypothetical protein
MSNFRHHTKVYSKCSCLLVCSWNLSPVCWWKDSSSCWMLLFALSNLMMLEKRPFGVSNVKSSSQRHVTSVAARSWPCYTTQKPPSRTNYTFHVLRTLSRNMTDQAWLRYKLWFMSSLTIKTHTWYVHVHVVDLTSLTTALIMVNDVICITWRHYGSTNCVRSLLRLASRHRYKQTKADLSYWRCGWIPRRLESRLRMVVALSMG